MQAPAILHKLIMQVSGSMHATRRAALEALVWAAVQSQALTVTGLGRALPGSAREKHCIKRADRLLSNGHLQGERHALYTALSRRLVGQQRHPVLLVDWSDLDAVKRHQVLRVSLALAGRALTLYEEVHDRRTALKRRTQRRFLLRLKQLLPGSCQPVLVTDAGFCTPWFREVERLDWYWVARLRQRHWLQRWPAGDWQPLRALRAQATATPHTAGEVRLTRAAPHRCRLVLYRGKPKRRHRWNRHGQRARNAYSEKHARRMREPWLLATNLPNGRGLAKRVVRLYRARMQIEEAFRDLKSQRFGLGLELHQSYVTARLAVLLLIGALALLLLWLIGSAARARGLARHYQANTVRRQTVLSTMFLGLRICARGGDCFHAADLAAAWQQPATLHTKYWAHAG
jgi:hypothetical protein